MMHIDLTESVKVAPKSFQKENNGKKYSLGSRRWRFLRPMYFINCMASHYDRCHFINMAFLQEIKVLLCSDVNTLL